MDWLLNLPVSGLALAILAAHYLLAAVIYMVVTRLAVGERTRVFKAISLACCRRSQSSLPCSWGSSPRRCGATPTGQARR